MTVPAWTPEMESLAMVLLERSTTGPWEVVGPGEILAAMDSPAYGHHLATVHEVGSLYDSERLLRADPGSLSMADLAEIECHANALLISNAPQFLGAAMAEMHRLSARVTELLDQRAEAIHQLRQAEAKVKELEQDNTELSRHPGATRPAAPAGPIPRARRRK